MKTLVPKRRFAGFSGEWEERKLGEFGTVAMNKRIFRDQTTETGEIPFYKIGTFGGEADSFIPRKLFEEYKAKYQYPEVGDILLSASGSIGKTVEYLGKEEYFQDSNIVWLKHDGRLNNLFLKQFYLIVKWEGLEGSTIKRLYNKNILATNVVFPNSEEQEKIGNFFSNLDNLISLNQQKLDKLKTTKSAYLTEMFPQEGELFPKRRFPGFTEPWERTKLSKLVNRFDNLRVPVTSMNRIPGKTPYYGANGILDYVQGYTHEGEYVLIAEDGANDLSNYPVHYASGKIWVNNHAHVVQAVHGVSDNKFLKYSLSIFNLQPYLVGGSRAKLNAETMMDLILNTPTLAEQTKIGNFFSNLDSLITAQQNKLEKLKALKQAYLAEMFV